MTIDNINQILDRLPESERQQLLKLLAIPKTAKAIEARQRQKLSDKND